MSAGESSGSGTGFETLRGRNFPTIRQFTVFLENRVGALMEVVRRFEGTGIRIAAMSITDSNECAFLRIVVTDPDRGREILERAGLAMIERDLIGVEIPNVPQPLLAVCTALLRAEINITQAYPLFVRPHGGAAIAIAVDNIELGRETLQRNGFMLINEGDLKDEPYH
jgi:hypothetical protein